MTQTGITAAELKATGALWGIDLVHPVTQQAFTDAMIEEQIGAAEVEYARDLSTCWGVKTIVSVPADGEVYDVADDGYDFRREDWQFDPSQTNWHLMRLKKAPIISIDKMELVFPDTTTAAFTVPLNWIKISTFPGKIRVGPTIWSAIALGGMARLNMISTRFGPKVVHVDYQAGIDLTLLDTDYLDLKQALINFSAQKVLEMMLAGLGQKGTSVSRSIAGVSHSFSGGPDHIIKAIEMLHERDIDFRHRWKEQMLGPQIGFIG
jgi:hypothetical protein